MARRRYIRRYYKKSKWSPNIQEILTTTLQASANGSFFWTYTLAFNPAQTNTTVSQVFTVKNIEVNFYVDTGSNAGATAVEDICAYIMFVPQGMTVGIDYNLNHPEYIMACKYLGSPSYDGQTQGQQYQPTKVRTRLSRKLQSGDNVILLLKGANLGTADTSFDIHGIIRWWTKAN